MVRAPQRLHFGLALNNLCARLARLLKFLWVLVLQS